MKKIVASIIIVLITFNFIVYNYSYGANPKDSFTNEVDNTIITGEVGAEIADGTSGGQSIEANQYGSSIIGTIVGALARLINYILLQVDVLMSNLSNNPEAGSLPDDEMFWFSIDKTVFNRVALFNINFFNTDDSYQVGDKTITADANNIKIKESISTSYMICRIIALAISLLVLIYIGIRMAISTVASEQARYKQMLISWVESIIILFAMPYIMSAFFTLGEVLTGSFFEIRNSLLGQVVPGSTNGEYGVFEETIRKHVFGKLYNDSGLSLALWSLIYWILLFTEIKFLWLYLKRVLMVGFLIIISPIITITYSIDKVGDGKSQAFNSWLKEFVLNVLIQPLHALLYLIFVFSANAIAASSPLVGVALLLSMGQAERMVKVIFDMKGSVTLRGVNKFMKKEG